MSAPRADRSKPVATWIALVAGSFGLHRFYLFGPGDLWGWAYPLPTLVGLVGVIRMRELGGDDQWAWVLIPFLGVTLAASMLSAIVYGLTPDDRWNARFAPSRAPAESGWATIAGVIVALAVGATVMMSTIAFIAQRYFEYQTLQAPAS